MSTQDTEHPREDDSDQELDESPVPDLDEPGDAEDDPEAD
jgi:hypothetical protein